MQNIIKRYDRQLRTYGLDTINNFNKSSILIMGSSNSYITEICKNAALSGINTIYIINYLKCYINLNELNPYINIINVNDYFQNQKVTILIVDNYEKEYINKLNEYTRSINSSLIILFPYKIGGTIFVDFGENHLITKLNDEIINNVTLKNIDNNGIVYSISKHNYQSDYISASSIPL